MKLKTILVVNAILLGLFGLTSLLAPEASATPYGLTLDPLSKHLNQVLGAFFLGLAVLSWMSRKVTDSNALRAILLAFFISYSIAMIILLIGFGYYLFVKPSAS